MDLSKVAVAIRPRSPWEAVDLGICMARHWWWPLVRVWLILTLPLFALLHLLPFNYYWIPPLLAWWTKPLWERALLFMLSQAIFGRLPSTQEAIRAFPALAKPQILAALTWRRLSPSRSMNLPVSQLEGLAGRRRRDRLDILHRQDAQPAGWLTIIGIHVEGMLAIAAIILAWMFVPSTMDINVAQTVLNNDFLWLVVLQNLLGYTAAAAVAPFYVAAGFALYLNRRVVLEGWDIEIAFRQMLQKRRVAAEQPQPSGSQGAAAKSPPAGTATNAAVIALAIFLGAAGLFPAQPGNAASLPATATEGGTTTELTPALVQAEIRELLAGESFHETKTVRHPVLFAKEDDEPVSGDMPAWWQAFVAWMAASMEVVLWCAVAFLIAVVLFNYRDWLAEFGITKAPRARPSRPDTLFGLDLRPESLPADVPATVRQLWQQGQTRAALSLLYRACLAQLVDKNVAIAPEHTEADCVHLARQLGSATAYEYFAQVTHHWQALAYGHRIPPGAKVNALCTAWPQVWVNTDV